ncbi:MAG: membrane protein insertion efficiency factor YidD [Rubrobacteraceae bacterium]
MAGRVFIGVIRLYQRFVSPLFPPSCRFTPSCSRYAVEAIRKRGAFKGSLLGIWRILRCNPFCKGGHDPVP